MLREDLELSVVIVTYNSKEAVLQCLKSVFERTGQITFEVIVVDNASQDGTADAIAGDFPRVLLIRNQTNRWFRPANNQGIRSSRGRYVLLLNPDTLLVTPGAFEKMVAFIDSHPRIGVLGVKLLDSDGRTQLDCDRLPDLVWIAFYYLYVHTLWPSNPVMRWLRYDGWDRNDTREVESVSGACMLIRRAVFEQVGLLDEAVKIYWEESDFCRAALQKGWQAVHYADVEIIHHWAKGGIRTGSKQELATLLEQSMLHYYRKYYGPAVWSVLFAMSMLRQSFRSLLRTLVK